MKSKRTFGLGVSTLPVECKIGGDTKHVASGPRLVLLEITDRQQARISLLDDVFGIGLAR